MGYNTEWFVENRQTLQRNSSLRIHSPRTKRDKSVTKEEEELQENSDIGFQDFVHRPEF
jgi:hypothetical protein